MSSNLLFSSLFFFSINMHNALAGEDAIKCAAKAPKEVSETITFATSGSKLAGLSVCPKIKNDEERYTQLNCQLITECSKAKIDESNIPVINPINDYLAEDYAAARMSDEIKKMDQLEKIRNFNAIKYDKKGLSTCSPVFDSSEDPYLKDLIPAGEDCNTHLLDSGFERLQRNCETNPELSYCFKNEPGAIFKDYKTFVPSQEDAHDSKMASFFRARSRTSTIQAMANEKSLLFSFATLMTETEISKEEKLKQAYEFLSQLRKEGKLDPILSVEDSLGSSFEDYKKSAQYHAFDELLNDKAINRESAIFGLEKFRMETSVKFLKTNCTRAPNFRSLCRDTTRVTTYGKPEKFYPALKSKGFDPKDEILDGRLDILKEFYGLTHFEMDDYKLLMDSHRCSRLFYGDDRSELSSKKKLGLHDQLRFSNEIRPERQQDLSENEQSIIEKYAKDQAQNLSSKGPDDFKSLDMSVLKSDKSGVPNSITAGEGNEKIISSDLPKESFSPKNAQGQNNPSLDNNYNSQGNTYFTPARTYSDFVPSVEQAIKTQNSEVKKDRAQESNDLNDKIVELNKKLAASEENLARIQKEEAQASAEKARQEKINESTKTIADLKKQISEMRSQSKNAKVENGPAQERQRNDASESSPFIKEGSSVANVTSGPAVHTGDMAQASSNAAAVRTDSAESKNEFERSVSGNRIEPVSSQASGEKGTGLVLTKVDGMSSEKVSETIGQKIMENGGSPFFIEEEGMIKEIVPVLKDGKVAMDAQGRPVYEKKLKGKAGDQKILRGLVLQSSRSIASVGDLKRDQEEKLKRERAEYLKLKKLTSESLEKK